MAEFKKAIEKTLKPFARKVGSDIKGIESKVFVGKPINVVEFGIDNTGATDVTAKLNELFQKVHAEDYTEVIFPDGTYKISGPVNVTAPSDRKKYVYIHAQNRYKAKIEMHGTRETTSDGYSIYVGFQLQPENFEATTTRGYNVRFDGFVIEGHELPADETNQSPSTSIYAIMPSQENHENFNISEYKLYNFTCTNMEFINTYYTINLNYNIFDADLKNIYIDGAEYPLDLSSSYSNNNSLDNITIKNCKNGTNVSVKCSVKNIDIIYDKESIFADNNMPSHSFSPYLMSNVSIKGFYSLAAGMSVLTISTQSSTISDIRLDLKPISVDNVYQYESYVPAFIDFSQSSSESGLVNVSDVTFEKFEENFASVFEKVPKFAFFNTSIPLSLHNVSESDHLKFFTEKAINVTYEKSGSYNLNYNTKNESFKPRPYLGTDRNINGTDQALDSTFGAIYLASSKGTPLTGTKGEDFSENTAGVKGDIFTELEPEEYGHFAYVSTYENTTKVTIYKRDCPITSFTYNSDDKTYTATFAELPKFKNGTMANKIVNVGSILENLESGPLEFEITAVNEDAKTLTLKPYEENKQGYAFPYTIDATGTTGDPVFVNGFKIKPRKVNRMKNMTYVTVPIIHSGATENRPTEHLVVGQMYFDTTVGAPVFWNGTEWIQGNNGSGSVDTSNLATKQELHDAIAAIPAGSGGSVDTSNLATKAELAAIPANNVTQDDNHYFVTKYQNKKLQDLYNKGEMDTKFATKADVTSAIAAIPAATPVDTSNFVTKQELDATLNAINEKLKQIHGGN